MTPIPDFRDKMLLLTALTHRSALNEHATAAHESNERLEYLGDAVLELVSTEFLYHHLPDAPEGRLTSIRSSLVKTTTLSGVARELGLGDMLYLSRGEEAGGGRHNDSLLADTLEALIGAIYLDQGLEVVRAFVEGTILCQFDEIVEKKLYLDAKSHLQERLQSFGYETPVYQVVKEIGPDHDKSFVVRVAVGTFELGLGEGRSKQQAQQAAAAVGLERLEDEALVAQIATSNSTSDSSGSMV